MGFRRKKVLFGNEPLIAATLGQLVPTPSERRRMHPGRPSSFARYLSGEGVSGTVGRPREARRLANWGAQRATGRASRKPSQARQTPAFSDSSRHGPWRPRRGPQNRAYRRKVQEESAGIFGCAVKCRENRLGEFCRAIELSRGAPVHPGVDAT